MPGRQYSDTEREAAVAVYVAEGTYKAASDATGISADTIRAWKLRNAAWWEEAAERARAEYAPVHDAAIRQTMEASLEQLRDRVLNGDYVLDKEGNQVRMPVKARDLVIAAGTMFDKLRIIRGQPTSIAGKADVTAQDKLEALKQVATGGEPSSHARPKPEDGSVDPVH